MSTPAACLLFSQFVPASAQLLAEYRRLRGSLPPAEECDVAATGGPKDILPHAPMMSVVRLCVHPTSRGPTCCAAKQESALVQVMRFNAHDNLGLIMRSHHAHGSTCCQPYLQDLAAVFCLKQCHAWAQIICNIMLIEMHITQEQLRDPDVHDAKEEGMMCPALVKLVCEALGCSGSDPDGTACLSDAFWARTEWQRMRAPV